MENMISTSLLILVLVVPALASDDWDTFYNNFATDLTPLLALFGEQVTKHFRRCPFRHPDRRGVCHSCLWEPIT
jgi:hypothetical protein